MWLYDIATHAMCTTLSPRVIKGNVDLASLHLDFKKDTTQKYHSLAMVAQKNLLFHRDNRLKLVSPK